VLDAECVVFASRRRAAGATGHFSAIFIQWEERTKTMEELLKRVRALAALLERPEPGASTWVASVDAEWRAIADMWITQPRERLLRSLHAEVAKLPDSGIVLLTGMARELESDDEGETSPK
jgi:hypothetical protein